MNTGLKESTCRRPSRPVLYVALGLLVNLSLTACSASAQNDLTVRVYSCLSGQAPATADRLRTEFGVFTGVRIAADERTSQVIVQAPAEIQSRVGRRLAAVTPAAAARQPGNREASTAAPQSRSITLRNATAPQVERALSNILGSRLTAMRAERPPAKQYRLALSGGEIEVTVDPATSKVTAEGPVALLGAFVRLVQVLDSPSGAGGRDIRLLALKSSPSPSIQQVAEVVRSSGGSQPAAEPLAAMLYQPKEGAAAQQPKAPATPPAVVTVPAERPGQGKGRGGLLGPVQIEMLDGLDVLVLRGNAQDVEQVMEIINQIERLSAETKPKVEVLPLHHVDCQAMAALVQQIYNDVFLSRQGSVSITPLVKPNSMLIVGKPENVRTVTDLIARLDQPVAPDTQFQVFHLKYASAGTVQGTIQDFYADRQPQGTLGPAVRVTYDARSNALIVQAAPRDMAEVADLIHRLDTATSAAVNEVRIIQLKHSQATDIRDILQEAIGASTGSAGQQGGAGAPPLGAARARPTDSRASSVRRCFAFLPWTPRSGGF